MFLTFFQRKHLYLQGTMCAGTKQLQNQRGIFSNLTSEMQFFGKTIHGFKLVCNFARSSLEVCQVLKTSPNMFN